MAVIGKVLFLAIENCSGYWAMLMENYIYDEKDADPTSVIEEEKIGTFEYHPSKLWLICLYHIGCVFSSPLLGK